MINHLTLCSCFMLCAGLYLNANRSIHRPHDPCLPEITTFWTDDPQGKKSTLQSYYLEEWALFNRYDETLLNNNRLPEKVSYRYEPTQEVSATTLSATIEACIKEIFKIYKKPKVKEFKDFTILKDRNFNYKMHAGLIILKFKNYPFIVKLFIDNPDSFTKPYSKGTETCCFFIMGGGMNRYLAGLTRIPNLYNMQEKVKNDPKWSQKITFPRKWFWTPQNVRYFTVVGKNIGTKPTQSQNYPSIYAIICDEIAMDQPLNAFNAKDRKIVKEVAQFFGNTIDPHVYNFFIEKNTGKIAIIDTEHFASIVGLKEPLSFEGNFQWYTNLANKGIRNTLFKSKKMRKDNQKQPTPSTLLL